MFNTVSSAQAMIAGMNPELKPENYVFCTLPPGFETAAIAKEALATFREEEGLSVLLPEDRATALGLSASTPMRQITLRVYSALEGVGLTAAVATSLAAKGIPCNMIAATLHDHVFVPAADAQEAMAILTRLQAEASRRES